VLDVVVERDGAMPSSVCRYIVQMQESNVGNMSCWNESKRDYKMMTEDGWRINITSQFRSEL